MASDLFVVIPTSGRSELLRRTLKSLEECQKPKSYRETIVVENGQKGSIEEIVKDFRSSLNAKYQYVGNANKSNALNQGIRTIPNGLIFLTDDDVRFHPRVLCAYDGESDKYGSGQIYGGPVRVDYQREPEEWLKPYLPSSAKGWSFGEDDRRIKVIEDEGIAFIGLNWALFRKDIEKAGWFNPNFGPGSPTGSRGQETEMQIRLQNVGMKKVYIPEAIVWHYVPPDRCTPIWALKRIYQTAVRNGQRRDFPGYSVFGYPVWMFIEVIRKGMVAIWKSTSIDIERRFAAYYRLFYFLGYMHGARISNRYKQG
jgi:glycosyltransferase involved in cell wall biosynthesis